MAGHGPQCRGGRVLPVALPLTGDDLHPRLTEIPDQSQGHAVVDVGDNSDHRRPSRGAVPLSMPKISQRAAAGRAYFQLFNIPQNIHKNKRGRSGPFAKRAKKRGPLHTGPAFGGEITLYPGPQPAAGPAFPPLPPPAHGKLPCPPGFWAAPNGTRCRRGGRTWRCSFWRRP